MNLDVVPFSVQLSDVEFDYSSRLKEAQATSRPAFKCAQFAVKPTEHLFVYGPSGSGKTTLLGIITGILSPHSGVVSVLGTDLAKCTPSQKDAFRAQHIGYIFQQFNLVPYLSAKDNIMLSVLVSPARKAKLGENGGQELGRLAKALGIESILEKKPWELSVGQAQRVAAARALLGAPEIFICDEPTSSLDMDHRDRFVQTLIETATKQNSTVIFVSHDTSLRKHFSRSVLLTQINQGGNHVAD